MPCACCGQWIPRPIWIEAPPPPGALATVAADGTVRFATCGVCAKLVRIQLHVTAQAEAKNKQSLKFIDKQLQRILQQLDRWAQQPEQQQQQLQQAEQQDTEAESSADRPLEVPVPRLA